MGRAGRTGQHTAPAPSRRACVAVASAIYRRKRRAWGTGGGDRGGLARRRGRESVRERSDAAPPPGSRSHSHPALRPPGHKLSQLSDTDGQCLAVVFGLLRQPGTLL